LVIAAGARGDELEQARLVRSAPKDCCGRPDYVVLSRALDKLADVYLIHQLDLVGRIWRWKFVDENQAHSRQRKQAGAPPRLPIPVFCYLLMVYAEGWRRFCAELQIDPDALLAPMPGYHIVLDTEAIARRIGYTAEHALDCEHAILGTVDGADDEASRPPTPEEVAAMFQENFQKLCELQ